MTDDQHTALPAPMRASMLTALQPQVPAGPSFGRDLVRTLHQASAVVVGLASGGEAACSDVEVSAFGAVVCTGDTPADALEAAAAVARRAPLLEIHALVWARVEGDDSAVEYKITMTVSAPEPGVGEHGDFRHRA
ncbi:hypothetical protein [Streptomyces sp. NPDC089919]|uniref:hypothetical protein n=1 Tax=Streptomyces sp. NPDC089919 TaxID=3155188 RepID=UPI003432EF1D